MVEKFTKHFKDITNIKGKQLGKEFIMIPNKGHKLSLFEVDKVYKKMLEKTSAHKILIRAKTIDGMKTLKAFEYIEDDLIHTLDEYYSSLPKEGKKKFLNLEELYIVMRY